jgi:glycosyltransferase involved in cell wall biosynthesis
LIFLVGCLGDELKIIHIGRGGGDLPQEGGLARDFAFFCYLENRAKLVEVGNSRIVNILKIFTNILVFKYDVLVMHYPLIGIPVSNRFYCSKWLTGLFFALLKIVSKKKSIVIDISDLPIEQATDLEIAIPEYYSRVEKKLFGLNASFVFASSSMKDYALKKYGFNPKNTHVCINGGPLLENLNASNQYLFASSKKVKFVYAGTLNRGRQIELMIEIFSGNQNVELVLLGKDGEWIEKKYYPDNVHYLGPQDESVAHYITSLCDVGLIPYDSSRLYYNIAYPTKLSFYLTAGIPFLSTPVSESISVHKQFDVGFVEELEGWANLIGLLTGELLKDQKERTLLVRNEFQWDVILNSGLYPLLNDQMYANK